MLNKSRVILGDCLDKMKLIPDNYVDFICCDLPYGTTSNKDDIVIPFDLLWEQYNRILKKNGAVALYAQGLFYVNVVNSNRSNFRYDYVWNKILKSGFLNAKKMPLRVHEQIAIFYRKFPTYNPQKYIGTPSHTKGTKYKDKKSVNNNYGDYINIEADLSNEKYPTSILSYQKPHPSVSLHRTEKSIECNEFLIKTYTNENDVVLDNTSGSATTGISCINTNRNFVLIEKDPVEYNKGKNRILQRLCISNVDFDVLFSENF